MSNPFVCPNAQWKHKHSADLCLSSVHPHARLLQTQTHTHTTWHIHEHTITRTLWASDLTLSQSQTFSLHALICIYFSRNKSEESWYSLMNPFVVFSYFSKIHGHLSLKLITLNSNLQTNIYSSNFLKQKILRCQWALYGRTKCSSGSSASLRLFSTT